MADLTLRTVKGTPLTNSELDANFTALNTDVASRLLAPTSGGGAGQFVMQAVNGAPAWSGSILSYNAMTGDAVFGPLSANSFTNTFKFKTNTVLHAGNVKTVNGNSILGSGNIQIDGGVTSFNTRTGAITLTGADITAAIGGGLPVDITGVKVDPANGDIYIGGDGTGFGAPGAAYGVHVYGNGTVEFAGGNAVASPFGWAHFAQGYFQVDGVNLTATLGGSDILTASNVGNYATLKACNHDAATDGEFLIRTSMPPYSGQGGVMWSGSGFSFSPMTGDLNMGGIYANQYIGTLTFGGNTVLHAGNYTNYAMPSAGNGDVGGILVNGMGGYPFWSSSGQLSYNPMTMDFTASGISANTMTGWFAFNGNAVLTSANYSTYVQSFSPSGSPTTGEFVVQGFSGPMWSGSNLSFNPMTADLTMAGIAANQYAGTFSFNSNTVLHAGNYTGYVSAYAPSLTGSGAFGTWGISVTGSAFSVSGGSADVTTLTASSNVTLNGGTMNGVAYLNSSKVLTTGSALTYDGITFAVTAPSSFTGGVGFSGAGNPSSGSSVEITFGAAGFAGVGRVMSYDRTGAVRKPLAFDGSYQQWLVNNSESMRLDSAGNLGIGTSSPGAKLDVRGTIDSRTSDATATNNAGVRLYGTASATATSRSAGIVLDPNGADFVGVDYSIIRMYASGELEVNNQLAAGYLTLKTNSSERMRLDSSGNVGIGTTSPGAKLDVSGSLNGGGVLRTLNSYNVPTATNVTIYTDGSTGTALAAGYVYRVRLTTTGTGTYTGASYVVYQTAASTWVARLVSRQGSSSNHPSLAVSGTTLVISTAHPSTYTVSVNIERFQTGNSTLNSPAYFGIDGVMTYDGETNYLSYTLGNVGIGTNAPGALLDVRGNSGSDTGIVSKNDGAGRAIVKIDAGGTSQSNINFFQAGVEKWRLIATGGSSFGLYDATAAAYRLFVDSSGNLGIGTSSPGTKLAIQGAQGTEGAMGILSQMLSTTAYNASPIAGISLGTTYNAGGSVAGMGGIAVGKENATDGNYAGYLALYTRPNGGSTTERLRIDSAGNVGIGVTPQTWGSNFKAIELVGATAGVVSAYVNNLNFGTNFRSDNTNWIYTYSGQSSTRYEMHNSGQHRWHVAASGVANSTSVTSGVVYVVYALGSSTLAQWQALFSGLAALPTVGQTITATATGTLAGGGTVSQTITFKQAMTLNATGDLGLGTTTPTSIGASITSLTVAGPAGGGIYLQRTSATTTSSYIAALSGELRVSVVDALPLTFFTTNTERARIDSSGNLLVGQTAKPGSVGNTLAFVAQGVTATNSSTTLPYFQTYNGNAGADLKTWRFGGNSIGALTFETVNDAYSTATERARIDSSGNLGLGVTPSAWNSGVRMIEFTGAAIGSNNTPSQMYLLSNAYLDSVGWKYKISNYAAKQEIVNGTFAWYTAPSGTAGSSITFTQAMTLDASGQLGIGVTSPSAKLHVVGSKAILQAAGPSQGLIQFGTTDTTHYIGAGNDYLGMEISSVGSGNTGIKFITGTSGSGTTNMLLDQSGNLGLGVTPSAWDSSLKVFENTAGAYAGYSVSGVLASVFYTNVYSSGGDKYKTSTRASKYEYDTNSGAFKWYTAPSGTAGSSITFTQAMTLDATGNLLLGITTGDVTNGGIACFPSTAAGINMGHKTGTATGSWYFGFLYNGTTIGSISQNGTTATAYNTSSDYRLKNITGRVSNSGEYIDALNPVEGTWKADGSVFVGLIAHEVQAVSRTGVATGVKDGEQMQAMDYSSPEIIANLIAEVQSLRKRVADLEAASTIN